MYFPADGCSEFPTPFLGMLQRTVYPFRLCFCSSLLLAFPQFSFAAENNVTTGLNASGVVRNQTSQTLDGKVVKVYANGKATPFVDTTRNGGMWNVSNIPTPVEEIVDNIPSDYKLENNYPNPFNPSTNIEFSVAKSGNVVLEIYNILGQKVKTLVNEKLDAGKYRVAWGADDNAGNGVSAGVYLYRLVAGDYSKARKMIKLDGGKASGSGLVNIGSSANPGLAGMHGNALMKTGKTATATIDSIVVSGQGIATKSFTNPAWQNLGDGNYDVGNLQVDQINKLIVGPVYDVNTGQPIQNLEVFLKSNPAVKSSTGADGKAILQTISAGSDSLFVIDRNATNTTGFYTWADSVYIMQGDNVYKAFSDTNGVPNFQRQKLDGRDLLEHIIEFNFVKQRLLNDNQGFKQTLVRLKSPTVKLFMNRDIAPESWYPDSLLAGMKRGWEHKGIQIEEVSDSAQAQGIVRYNNSNLGNAVDFRYSNNGPYSLERFVLWFRGPPNGTVPAKELVPYVGAHELGHALAASPYHDADSTYIMYGNPASSAVSQK